MRSNIKIKEARTIHPLPVKFMIDVDVDNTSSSDISEATIMRRGRSQSIILTEGTEWLSKKQLNEEKIESLEKQHDIPHSIYYNNEKYIIVALGGISGFWSSISSPIYLPVLPVLQNHFNVNEEKMNVTVVVYSIFQGLAPILFSNLADKFGRRILILMCLFNYVLVNIGLAFIDSFAGLVLLRCLQAFAISSTLSIASGIASDITIKSERASFIGLSTGLSLLGQAFGALLGGMISSAFGWRAIFWFLAIFSGVTLVIVWTLLPETTRSLVGNGASLPEEYGWISIAPILSLPHFLRRRLPKGTKNTTITKQKPFNMFAPFSILKCTPVYLTLIPASLSYALWLMMLTTLSTSLSTKYGFSTFKIALAYIPSGIGGLLGSVTIGEMLDWSYKRHYKKYLEENKKFKEDSQIMANNNFPKFNIFKARLTLTSLPTCLSAIGALLFGWTIQARGPVGLILVGSCFVSYAAMNYLTISTTILVDLFPNQSSGSSSCVNLTRCWCAALFVAVLSRMDESMTVGGCYTFMTGICSISSLCVVYIIVNSEQWI